MSLAVSLAHSYSALLRGLFYPGSESDAHYEPFDYETLDEITPEITPETFRQALDLAPWWEITMEPANKWFADVSSWSEDPNGGNSPLAASLYRSLQSSMEATLIDSKVVRLTVRAGDEAPHDFHRTRHYVLGETPLGGWAGIVVWSVET